MISNVYYVSKLKNNILSLGQFLENGYEVYMKDHTLPLRDQSGSLITKVPMSCNRLFTLTLHKMYPCA